MQELLFVSTNRHFGETLRKILSRTNTNVTIATSFGEVQRFAERYFHFLLVDMVVGEHSAADLIEVLSPYQHFDRTERWLMGESRIGRLERKQLKADLEASQFFAHPFSPLDVLDALVKPKTVKQKVLHLSSLRLVSQVWVSKSSMVLKTNSLKVIFMGGSVVSHSNLKVLEQLLSSEIIHPKPIQETRKSNNWEDVGRELLRLSEEAPPVKWTAERADKRLDLKLSSQLFEGILPSDSVRRLSSRSAFAKHPQSFKNLCYGLWKMGLVSFAERDQQVLTSDQKKLKAQDVLKILEADVQRCDSAPASKILGVSSGSGVSEIVSIAQRMEDRYIQIKGDYSGNQNIVSLADQMLVMVRGAADVLSGGGYVDQDSMAEHEKLYQYGLRQIDLGNWQLAVRSLTKANQMCIEDAKILAAKGWAEFNNPDKDEDLRQKEGMESLLLAVHFEKDSVDTLIYLTKAYLALGDPENALGPIKRASTLTPDPRVQELRSLVEERLST